MNPSTLSVLLLAGVLQAAPYTPWYVGYPKPFCVVEGSTTTIPCSFTYPKIHKNVNKQVNRVVWCPNDIICRDVPTVYNSSNVSPDSRFQYLGDLTGNCTLKIKKTSKRDAATYRFRMVTNSNKWTGQLGVHITVTDGEDVNVSSSIRENEVRRGGQVTLTCTSACSFHQLDVHWSRNGHTLSETGPVLHLSNLTCQDTGNYTCSVDSNRTRTSAPWSLVVEDEGNCYSYRGVSVAMGVLVGVIILILAGFVFAKRRHSAKKDPKGVDSEQEVMGAPEEVSYSAVHFKPHPSRRHSAKKLTHPKGVDGKQEVMGAPEEVSYSAVNFKPHPSRRHPAKKDPKGVDSKQEVMGVPEEVSYSAVHFKPHPSRSACGQEEETVYSQVVR